MQDAHSRPYAILIAVGVAIACVIPALLGHWAGDGYLGYQYNTDDHMVYAAWMRQAMDGRFFFDNRFTLDAQPGLTVHVYFFALGLIAKFVGIATTVTLARAMLSGLFVWLAYGLICKLTAEVFARKLALALTVFGGGLGFLVWHNFGVDIVKPALPGLREIMLGRLPIDVWQPEAFVFPSMLTNSLFMAALCLIVVAVRCILDAKESWKPVPLGFCAFAILANIHSYDVALLGLVLVAFLAMELSRRQATWMWVLRAGIVVAGAVGPAIWLEHVLRVDPVFQARAATETFSPPFLQVFWGLPLLIAPALIDLWNRPQADPKGVLRRRIGLGVVCAAIVGMCVFSVGSEPGYWMGPAVWAAVYLTMIAAACLIASEDRTKNFLWAWALVGIVAIYFPALFQRKLAMGLVVPWAMLAAIGLAGVIAQIERGARNVATVLAILVLSGSSLLWFNREKVLLTYDVSNTTLHPVHLGADAVKVLSYLNAHRDARTVVLAMPGIAAKGEQPDVFLAPFMPDLNPILSGLAGVYTYAGHWSETPDYGRRRSELTAFFLADGKNLDPREFLLRTEADYIVAPVPEAFIALPAQLRDMRVFGRAVVEGPQFRLIRVNKAALRAPGSPVDLDHSR